MPTGSFVVLTQHQINEIKRIMTESDVETFIVNSETWNVMLCIKDGTSQLVSADKTLKISLGDEF